MKIRYLLACALLCCAALSASEIWQYSVPSTGSAPGDPNFPHGLGNRLNLTITFDAPVPRNINFIRDEDGFRGYYPDGTQTGEDIFVPQYRVTGNDGTIRPVDDSWLRGINFLDPANPIISGGPDRPELPSGISLILDNGIATIVVCKPPPNSDLMCGVVYSETFSPGSWRITTAPEPHAMFMLPAGLLALWAIPRWRQVKQPSRKAFLLQLQEARAEWKRRHGPGLSS